MPKVPTRDVPELTIKPQPIDPRSAAAVGGEIIDLAKGIGALGNQLEKMQDESQTNKAEADLLNRFSSIHSQFANDKDLNTAPQRAQEELDKAVNESSNIVTSRRAREEFQGRAGIEKARKSSDLNNMFVSKGIKEAKHNMFNNVDSIIKQAWDSSNPAQINQAKQKMSEVVSKAVSTGYIHPEVAKNYLDDHIGKLIEGQVDHDVSGPGMAETVLSELKKGSKGAYPDLDPQVRQAKIKMSESMVKKQENQRKEALKGYQSDNGNYLVTLSKEGKLTPQVIQEFGYTGRISKKEFNGWMKKIESPIINENTDAETYNQSIHYMTDPKNSADSVREHLLSVYSEDKLSKEDFMSLYEMHLRPLAEGDFQSLQNVYGKEKKMKDVMTRHKNFLQSAITLVGKYSGQDPEKTKSMLASWAAKTNKSSTPEDYPRIANEVIKEQRLIDRPEIASYPDDGRVVQDEEGYRSTITPDGNSSEEEIMKEDSDNAPSGY